jgi:hypothetical protein
LNLEIQQRFKLNGLHAALVGASAKIETSEGFSTRGEYILAVFAGYMFSAHIKINTPKVK